MGVAVGGGCGFLFLFVFFFAAMIATSSERRATIGERGEANERARRKTDDDDQNAVYAEGEG